MKSHVFKIFEEFNKLIENYFRTKIKTINTDGGGEYRAVSLLLTQHRIQHLTSSPYTPEHVGSVERKHCHIVETGLILLHNAAITLHFWSHAFQSAIYLIIRMPIIVHNHGTPYHKLFGHRPTYTSLRVFGRLCYPWLHSYGNHKLKPHSRPCAYLKFSFS